MLPLEDDDTLIAEGADIRWRSRSYVYRNALSVKLRGSHAPLRSTTRSTSSSSRATAAGGELPAALVQP